MAEHTLFVCPAGHLGDEAPDSMWEGKGDKRKPRDYVVKFYHGEAETSDEIGRYLVAHGMAYKTRLVLPNSWNR